MQHADLNWPSLTTFPYSVFGGIAGAALLFCIAGIGLSYYIVKERFENKSGSTLDVEEVETGKSNHSTAKDLALPRGSDDVSPNSMSSSSSSNSSNSSSHSQDQIEDEDDDIESHPEDTANHEAMADFVETEKTKHSLSASLSDSSASALDEDLMDKIEERRATRARKMTKEVPNLDQGEITSKLKPSAGDEVVNAEDERLGSRKSGGKKKRLTQSNPDVSASADGVDRVRHTKSRRSANDLEGLDNSDSSEMSTSQRNKDHWKALKKSLKDDVKRLSNDRNKKQEDLNASKTKLAPASKDHWKGLKKSLKDGDVKRLSNDQDVHQEDPKASKTKPASENKDHWKALKKSLKDGDAKRLSNGDTEQEDLEASKPASENKDHWKALKKSLKDGDAKRLSTEDTEQEDLKASKTKPASENKDHWKALKKSLKDDAKRLTDDKDTQQEDPKASKTKSTPSTDNWGSLSKAVKAGRSQSLIISGGDFETNEGSKRENGKSDHWRSLSKSMQAGELTREPKKSHSKSNSTKKDHWKTLSNSVKASEIVAGNQYKPKSKRRVNEEEDHLQSVPEGETHKMRSRRSTNDLTESDGNRPERQRRRSSNDPPNQRSMRSSEKVHRTDEKQSRRRSNEMTQSREQERRRSSGLKGSDERRKSFRRSSTGDTAKERGQPSKHNMSHDDLRHSIKRSSSSNRLIPEESRRRRSSDLRSSVAVMERVDTQQLRSSGKDILRRSSTRRSSRVD